MNFRLTRLLSPLLFMVVLTGVASGVVSAAEGNDAARSDVAYTPKPGQPGKDVVWIPTPDHVVDMMLDMAQVTANDYLIDLGSGDGRMVIAAARRGARAHGVEFNPDLVELSKRAAAEAGVAERATFSQGDMFEADISRATAMALFLLPAHLTRLAPKFLQLRPGARVVSNSYEIGAGWEPDARVRADPCMSWCIASLYIVPAQVAGSWEMPGGDWLYLEQEYQKVTGTLEVAGIRVPVENGRMRGAEISFTVNRTTYTGRVDGDAMSGKASGGVVRDWTARRGM
jgi:hypothetical protein